MKVTDLKDGRQRVYNNENRPVEVEDFSTGKSRKIVLQRGQVAIIKPAENKIEVEVKEKPKKEKK